MSLKDRVMSGGAKLADHPLLRDTRTRALLVSLMQDERVMKLVLTALSIPGKLSELSEEQKQSALRFLGAAPQRELDDVKRALRALQDDVTRLQRERRG